MSDIPFDSPASSPTRVTETLGGMVRAGVALGIGGALLAVLLGPEPELATPRTAVVLGAVALLSLLVATMRRLSVSERLVELGRIDPFARGNAVRITVVLYLATRFPFLSSGSFGADQDANRIARAAATWWAEGTYMRSRPPGNPVVELAMGPVAAMGPVYTGTLTALVGLAGLWCFDRILREARVPMPLVGTVVFGLLPVSVLHTADTMDYAWALTAMLAAALAGLRGRWLTAGVLLGVALGCRMATGAFIPVLLGWGLLTAREQRGRVVLAGVLAAATAALCYAPVVATYGQGFMSHAPSPWDLARVHRKVWMFMGGLPALVGLVWLSETWRPRSTADRRHTDLLALGGLAAAVLPFLALPAEGDYLWPAVPFLLMLGLARVGPWSAWLAVAAVLLVGKVDLDDPARPGAYEGRLAQELPRWREEGVRQAMLRNAHIEPGTVVVVGHYIHAVHAYWGPLGSKTERSWGPQAIEVPDAEVVFASYPEPRQVAAALIEGRPVLVLNDVVSRRIQRKDGYDIEKLGADPFRSQAMLTR